MKKLLTLDESVLVFLHIKKTGGISIQKLIQEQYPGRFYGNDHSALKKKVKIKKSDINSIPNGCAVANHWTYDDFRSIKNRCNFIATIRNPVDRIVSAYNFFLLHHGNGCSFLDYIKEDKNINLFSKSIIDKNFMTEIYLFSDLKRSIMCSKILNNTNGMKHLNKTRYRYNPSSSEIEKFMILNSTDIDLYNILKKDKKNECLHF